MVKIIAYNPEHFYALTSYALTQDQARFTSEPADILDASKEDAQDYLNFSILYHEKAVGFFSLDFSFHRFYKPRDKKVVILRSLSLNPYYQGKGIAKKALLQLSSFIKESFSPIQEIALGVHIKNTRAYDLYKKVGYQPLDEMFIGERGPLYIMVFKI
ncbi:GNAT family N-acetyltransferase [Elizabethkingia argentiflava]|uniref:GNAT family N-acetyltransferase n=1 Tax=Elizabethkingia argenteiflava TaxID=2681556 RepID=A0A845PWB8_9FLAO|nr:GNAT family N-acetyltransferase [Elizabethkingia argenteiflava]NAW51925.1 GNAT family N-acetyltransferase [Elizabethkingia argenteiflava]